MPALSQLLASTSANSPVRLLVPQTAGTTNDLVARVLAPHLAADSGRPSTVQNIVGASGMLGMDAAAKAAPDGLTLLNNVSNTLTLPYFYKNLPFDVLADFEPVGIEGYGNHALVVHPSVPVSGLAQFLEYARANPEEVSYASPGRGTHHHLCMELIQAIAGVRFTHVSYKGSAGAIADMLAGQVQAVVLPMQIAVANGQAGRLKILGGTRKSRFPLYPDIPSLHEQGLDDFDVEPWFALWAPLGTPPELLERYGQLLHRAYDRTDVRERLARHGLVATPGSADALRRKAQTEHRMWGQVLASMNIHPE